MKTEYPKYAFCREFNWSTGEFYFDDVTVTSFVNMPTLRLKSSCNKQHASGIQKRIDRWDKCLNDL